MPRDDNGYRLPSTPSGWRVERVDQQAGTVTMNQVSAPRADRGSLTILDRNIHGELAEGINILAGRMYKRTGRKHVITSIELDADYARDTGILDGTEVNTAVGPVKIRVAGASAARPLPGVAPEPGYAPPERDRPLANSLMTTQSPSDSGTGQTTPASSTQPSPSTRYWYRPTRNRWEDRNGRAYTGPCACGGDCVTAVLPPARSQGQGVHPLDMEVPF